jgi:hypothetical protein
MNKTILLCSVVLLVAAVNVGLSFRTRALDVMGQKDVLAGERLRLQQELKEKAVLKRRAPLPLPQSFAAVVNEVNLMSAGEGLEASLVFPSTAPGSGLADIQGTTDFRGVQGMPIHIKIAAPAGNMDSGSVLDLVYLMEHETDLKISKIEQEGQEMRIQGMLYGI